MPRLRRYSALLPLLLLVTLFPARDVVRAQSASGIPLSGPPSPVARGTDLYCAGFISDREITPEFYIIGGEKESEQDWFSSSNVVYLNYGAKNGASVGESLSVIREKGKYENPYTGKDLGRYFEELGVLRIIATQRNVSIARVETSCSTMRLGDFVRAYDGYVGPAPREYQPLNRYDLPSGKLSGQIVLARDGREMLAERDVVYLDIGDKQGVKLGQYYTVYRDAAKHEGPVGLQFNPILEVDDDFPHRLHDYSDDTYKGPDFAIIKGKKDQDDIIEDRVGLPRKVVGEICIIRVEDKSATAIITRVAQEVFLGDYVEMQ
jgi:hypothetical protein